MTWAYVYFPQELAGFLKSSQLSWKEVWNPLEAAAKNGERGYFHSKVMHFEYDPEKDKYLVSCEIGETEGVWLTDKEFKQEVSKYTKGAPA